MLGKVKETIQKKLYQSCIEEYRNALCCQSDPYLLWIRETEQLRQGEEEASYPSLSVVYMEQCGETFDFGHLSKELILFVSKSGKIAPFAFGEIVKYFERHKDANIVYGDEDIWYLPEGEDTEPDNELTHRISPWVKPMWSPDTLFSYLYFGNVFAVRRSACKDIPWLGSSDYRRNLYDFVLRLTEQGRRAGHIERILFHRYVRGESKQAVAEGVEQGLKLVGVGAEYDAIREEAMKRRGIAGRMVADEENGCTYPVYEAAGEPLVSIIIPSKDNVDILKRCLRSIYKYTLYPHYEIIVVDNGSTAQARIMLQNFREECAFTYLYEPMEFNFSKMCNLGARVAKGEYLLLLNDDMEVPQTQMEWLGRLLGQASLPHVGTVGAKLLYPDSTLIQHAGVTNTVSGPGHKLKGMDDRHSYYYGHNRLIYDMIGVTAACLMMKKSLYDELGGLYEGLDVAYNDVDLCFRVCGRGLCNVQRNDVVLYHHESLSRGDDLQDEKKLERLRNEMAVLYKRHPRLYRQDPFNGTIRNAGESSYDCRWIEGYEFADLIGYHDEVQEGKPLPDMKHVNQAIMITVEECGREKYMRTGRQGKGYYIIKGWAFVPGADNARYHFKLLLVNEQGQVWEIPVVKRYRKDVEAILEGQTNVAMTGFCCWLYEGSLPAGTYQIWMTAKDCCSRQRLYRSAERELVIC